MTNPLPKPIVIVTKLPPLNLRAHLSRETHCPRCENWWSQRKSQHRRICPDCRAREKEMGKR